MGGCRGWGRFGRQLEVRIEPLSESHMRSYKSQSEFDTDEDVQVGTFEDLEDEFEDECVLIPDIGTANEP